MRARLTSVLAAVLAAGLITPAIAQGGLRQFNVPLTGAAEVPGPGDPKGGGTAALRLDLARSQICYDLKVANISLPATGAHIHRAPATESGSVVVLLSAPGPNGLSTGCTAVTHELAQEILADPAQFYVNVHTTDRPAGALRGQLSAPQAKPAPK
ncbi:CHRD domain-containing protein [Phenylobacterium sp. LjRoot219]|uniref:CHRD domain-containing protein n=1 Tax=Phenylobacterium sp. LjRoot219 TaxID=3342283 RepID=UPI003ECC795A